MSRSVSRHLLDTYRWYGGKLGIAPQAHRPVATPNATAPRDRQRRTEDRPLVHGVSARACKGREYDPIGRGQSGGDQIVPHGSVCFPFSQHLLEFAMCSLSGSAGTDHVGVVPREAQSAAA